MSTVMEIGYDNVESQRTGDKNNQYKITPAITNGILATASGQCPGYSCLRNSPPSGMRNGLTTTPVTLIVNANFGKAVPVDFNGGSFGRGDSDEWIFGAQMEIWW